MTSSDPQLLQIAAEIFDTLERLNEIGERLQHCLERYKVYTAGDPLSGPLRRSLVDFYIHVIQFSITASQIYWKRRISTLYLWDGAFWC